MAHCRRITRKGAPGYVRYQVRWFDTTGRQRTRTFAREETARKYCDEVARRIEAYRADRRSLMAQAVKRASERQSEFYDAANAGPVVYYMKQGDLIKIGTTTNLKGRVRTLSVECVLAVEPGGRVEEQSRHEQFSEFHSHLEWFHAADNLLRHVLACQEAFPVDVAMGHVRRPEQEVTV